MAPTKRTNPDLDQDTPDQDKPVKKQKTSGDLVNKGGRPRNVGESQYNFMLAGYADYDKLKKKNATAIQIGAFYNDKTFEFIGKYGWENPQRALLQDVPDATPDVVAATRAVAKAAGDAVANRETTVTVAELKEHDRKDKLVAEIHGEISRLYQRLHRNGVDPDKVFTPPALDIPMLIQRIMAKPTLRQLYQVWAKSKARPELDAEVDKRHVAGVEANVGKASSRGAVWNTVAAEWYNAASDAEKEETRVEAEEILNKEIAKWEEQSSADPATPEEAHEFADRSRDFLGAMMQFFANRASGIAVMFLAGPNGVILSEAVMDVNGMPKVKYSDVQNEAETLRLVGERILTQARLLNETKWGTSFHGGDAPTSAVNHGEDIVMGSAGPSRSSSSTQCEGESDPINATADGVPEQGGSLRGVSPDVTHVESGLEPMAGADVVEEAERPRVNSTAGEKGVDAPDSSEPKDVTHFAIGGETRTLLTNVADGGIGSGSDAAVEAERTLAAADKAVRTDDAVPSVMAFDVTTVGHSRLQVNETTYKKIFEKASSTVTSAKAWYSETNSHNFLKNVPQKLQGKVDVRTGCELAIAYLELETSTLAEHPLEMVPDVDESLLPEYMATFESRKWAARWNKRMDNDGPRTNAALDADIHITLPRQWARLQPGARLNVHGQIAVQANESMSWVSGLAPGPSGARLLVIALLNWGGAVNGSAEAAEWRLIAMDVTLVLHILAAKTGSRGANPLTSKSVRSSKDSAPEKKKETKGGEVQAGVSEGTARAEQLFNASKANVPLPKGSIRSGEYVFKKRISQYEIGCSEYDGKVIKRNEFVGSKKSLKAEVVAQRDAQWLANFWPGECLLRPDGGGA